MTNRATENNNDVTINVTLDYLTFTKKEVYNLIKSNSKITRDEMAANINKNVRTVQRITNGLVVKGYIARIV